MKYTGNIFQHLEQPDVLRITLNHLFNFSLCCSACSSWTLQKLSSGLYQLSAGSGDGATDSQARAAHSKDWISHAVISESDSLSDNDLVEQVSRFQTMLGSVP